MRGALLDTMALLRMSFRPDLLSRAAGARILEDEGPLFYSIVSLWEIGIKQSRKGYHDLELPGDWDQRLVEGFAEQGIGEIPILAKHCKMIETLPAHHGDPFDRMLFAQALDSGLEVVSSDWKVEEYGLVRIW